MRKFVMLTVAAFALVTMLSVGDASAQGRGRGRGHGNGRWENDQGNNHWKWGKKCDKFVNCHDARDGRWDNRGPRRRLSWRTRHYSLQDNIRVYRGVRGRRVNGDRFYVRNRRRF